jgi:hypothetical protein
MRFDLTSKKNPLTALRVSRIWQHCLWGDLGNSLFILDKKFASVKNEDLTPKFPKCPFKKALGYSVIGALVDPS